MLTNSGVSTKMNNPGKVVSDSLLMRKGRLESPMTWVAETMLPHDGLVTLETRHIDELRVVARELAANPLPTEALRPDYFDMPA